MNLYGEELFAAGIAAAAATVVIAAVYICVYLAGASRLKKKLENEYGKKNK